jgi:hypothetical protein
MQYQYDDAFFDFVDASAGRSAKVFVESTGRHLFEEAARPAAVADFGCGRGAWARQWLDLGVPEVCGVDGDYVPREKLLISQDRFLGADLSRPVDIGRRFDLVQCLEVAEHIDPDCTGTLVDNLVRHADIVIFSAATPGQGGQHHVNERPHSFWRSQFAARGYRMYDAIRPIIRGMTDIEPWYRYNTFVFATDAGARRLSSEARAALITSGDVIPTLAPLGWRIRCFLVAQLPGPATDAMARLKHRLMNGIARQASP